MNAKRSPLSRPLLYDEAFVTSLCRYGEADCIVRLFTRREGRISAFFKRGLAAGKQGQSAIQAPCLARVGFLPGSDQHMARLVTADLDPRCFYLASSLKLFGFNAYVAELVEKLLPEQEPAEHIFELVMQTLDALASLGAQGYVLRAWELKLLDYLGYLPELPQIGADCFYDPVACRFALIPESPGFKFSARAIEMAQAMLSAPIGSQAYNQSPELMMIGRIFHSRLKLLGLVPLKSMAFFKQVALSQK